MEKLRGPGYKTKDDFKEYARKLREKTNTYRKMKDELKEIQTESGILARTDAILRAKKDQYDQILKQNEKKAGVYGASDLQDKLNEISQKKGVLDEKKGETLEEISKIVINIENQLKAKRNTLQPQIKELKDLRARFNVKNAII